MKGEIEFFIEDRQEDHVTSRMPVTPGMLNPFSVVHAGAMVWLADVTATVLARGAFEPGPNGKGFPLAIDLHAALLRNTKSGNLLAEASFVRRGRRVSVVRTRVTSEDGKPLIEMTTTHIPAEQ
ncbi:MAG: PaaI family thioesterase [Chloroflexi bacterium]|nr:PaaI family thioesterase [Chloroflexota bacterium]